MYGTHGSLSVPDPNRFDGEVRVKVGRNDWGAVPYTHGHRDNFRGLGAADMAVAIARGRPHRASGELGYHVLDVMATCLEAAAAGRSLDVGSSVERPAPLPTGGLDGDLD